MSNTATLNSGYEQKIVTDPELDNSEADEAEAVKELNGRVNHAIQATLVTADGGVIEVLLPTITVIEVIPYPTQMLFVLAPASFAYRAALEKEFAGDVRYSVETRDVQVDMSKENTTLSALIGRLPVTRQTCAIRRRAFKRPPLTPGRTLIYRVILTALLGCIVALLYNILFT
jgi:hypothetical protein